MHRYLIAAAVALALGGPAIAASFTTPRPGSPERKAILDAVRPEVERRLGAPIEFMVEEIRQGDGWAFVRVAPQRPGGGVVPNPDAEADGVHTEAVLRRRDDRWTVEEMSIGSTDVWWLSWCGRAPAGLIQGCY